MTSKIFVNVPVKDLKKSMAFFSQLGFTYDMDFTNEDAACMIIGNDNYVMLLAQPFFKTFTNKEIPDTGKYSEVILAVAVDNREQVSQLVARAFEAGAGEYAKPKDYGFMYQESFQDLDGHLWEVFYMDKAAAQPSPEAVEQNA